MAAGHAQFTAGGQWGVNGIPVAGYSHETSYQEGLIILQFEPEFCGYLCSALEPQPEGGGGKGASGSGSRRLRIRRFWPTFINVKKLH
jgi:hypothetical protein